MTEKSENALRRNETVSNWAASLTRPTSTKRSLSGKRARYYHCYLQCQRKKESAHPCLSSHWSRGNWRVQMNQNVLSPTQSFYLTALFPSLYVGSIYLRKQSRLRFTQSPIRDPYNVRIKVDGERWRDDSSVIKARLYAVCSSTLLSLTIVSWIAFTSFSPVSNSLHPLSGIER